MVYNGLRLLITDTNYIGFNGLQMFFPIITDSKGLYTISTDYS